MKKLPVPTMSAPGGNKGARKGNLDASRCVHRCTKPLLIVVRGNGWHGCLAELSGSGSPSFVHWLWHFSCVSRSAFRPARSTGAFLGFSAFTSGAGAASTPPASAAVPAASPADAPVSTSASKRTAGSVLVTPMYGGDDSDLNVCFRRLSKKESVTKLKALGELRELMPSRTKEVVAGCLPYWSYIYPKLCIENDARVREAAHTTFAELVRSAARRRVGSYVPSAS
jgi:hypothetical protein